jgi:hypothetical protein
VPTVCTTYFNIQQLWILPRMYLLVSYHLQNSNFTCYFVWEWNVVCRFGKNTDWGSLRTGCWGEYLDPRRMKWQDAGENCIMGRSIVSTFHQILLGRSNQGRGRGMWRTEFWLKAWREKTTRQTRRTWEDNIKMDLKEIWIQGVEWIHLAYCRGS